VILVVLDYVIFFNKRYFNQLEIQFIAAGRHFLNFNR